MAFPLFSPPSTILRLGLGLGIGLSAATLHPLSPFRAAPIRCEYGASNHRTDGPTSAETGWAVHPNDPTLQKPGIATQAKNALLTPDNMRQISLGSVLGLVAGVGLRAFSSVLVVLLGMGLVLVEVCGDLSFLWINWKCANMMYSGLRPRAITSFLSTDCKNTSRILICAGWCLRIGHSRSALVR